MNAMANAARFQPNAAFNTVFELNLISWFTVLAPLIGALMIFFIK
jgi:hypothetical protein